MRDDNKKADVKNSKPFIRVTQNGPYVVSGNVSISEQTIMADDEGTAYEWCEGKKYLLRENCVLCRCGQSKNKPFCDKTHVRVNFDGAEKATQTPCVGRAKIFNGPTLQLLDVEDLCASARFCHRAGGVWNLISKTDKPEERKIVIEEVGDCPSGRLIVRDKKTQRIIEPEYSPSIGIIEDPQVGVSGPIWVRGSIPVESCEGKIYKIRNRVTLCRCGKSSNKPFCDSSHYPEEHEYGE